MENNSNVSNNNINFNTTHERMTYQQKINKKTERGLSFIQKFHTQNINAITKSGMEKEKQENALSEINKIYDKTVAYVETKKMELIEKYGGLAYEKNTIAQLTEDLTVLDNTIAELAFLNLNEAKSLYAKEIAPIIKDNATKKIKEKIEVSNSSINIYNNNIEEKENQIKREKNKVEKNKLKAEIKLLRSELKLLIKENTLLTNQLANADHAKAMIQLANRANVVAIETLSKESVHNSNIQAPTTLVEEEKLGELNEQKLHPKRYGVIGIHGEYKFEISDTLEKIQKQFKSFSNQSLSDKPREVISRIVDISIGRASITAKTELIPLNTHFDEEINKKFSLNSEHGSLEELSFEPRLLEIDRIDSNQSIIIPNNDSQKEEISLFGMLFGDTNISSANRTEKHVVNPYSTSIRDENNELLFRGLRHAIATDMYETDPVQRATVSRQIAEELIIAALLQEISESHISLEEASLRSQEHPFELNLTSVSLVTPDIYRKAISFIKPDKKTSDERTQLQDQKGGFSSAFELNKTTDAKEDFKTIKDISGFEFIDMQIGEDIREDDIEDIDDTKPNTPTDEVRTITIQGHEIRVKLNVNQFNFGVNEGVVKYRTGTRKQFEENLPAWNSLKTTVDQLEEKRLITIQTDLLTPQELSKITLLFREVEGLKNDIDELMEHQNAYLGNIQYEAGAKILLLMHTMNRISKICNEKMPVEHQFPVFTALFNCKSGKDRTGIMNDVVFTLALMAKLNGRFPSREDLAKNEDFRAQFKAIFSRMVLESGSIDITEVNTDTLGYKVGDEVSFNGLLDDFIVEILRGLSKTTSG